MLIDCTISTPQFKDNKVHHYHKQSGRFDDKTMLFTPYRQLGVGGDHAVQFASLDQFAAARTDTVHQAFKDKYQLVWWRRPHVGFIRGNPHKQPAAFHLIYRWSLWLGWLEVRRWLTPQQSFEAVLQYMKRSN